MGVFLLSMVASAAVYYTAKQWAAAQSDALQQRVEKIAIDGEEGGDAAPRKRAPTDRVEIDPEDGA